MLLRVQLCSQVKKTPENQKAEEISEEVAEGGSIEVGELRQSQPSMANTISNMKMTNPIKGLVSKRRKRFTEDGFDLDLTCILLHTAALFLHTDMYANHEIALKYRVLCVSFCAKHVNAKLVSLNTCDQQI